MKSRIYRFLSVIAALAFLFSVRVQPLQANVTSVTLTNPGTRAEAPEYFTDVWGNPKDMNDPTDMYVLSSTCNPTHPARWSNTSYSDGIWKGTTASSASQFRYLWLLNPGWASSLDTGEDGQAAKISTGYYKQLSFRMRVQSGANLSPARSNYILWADGPVGTTQRGTQPFVVVDDGYWHIYTFDMSDQSGWTSGSVSSLWIQLNDLDPGYTVEVDWVRLTPGQSFEVDWSGSGLSGDANIYLGANPSDTSQRSHLIIYEGTKQTISASTRSLTIPASLPAGTYAVRVADSGDGANSGSSWQIVGAPVAQILAPSYSSGADWATTVTGNPWDMNGTDDIDAAETQTLNYSAASGVLNVTNVADGKGACDSPWPHRPLALNTHGQWIDTSKYKYLSFRYKVDQAPDQGAGGVIRARWLSTSVWAAGRTDDISLYNSGWNTYELNLATVALEAETAGWTERSYNWFHLMANESHFAWTTHLDWVKLTADNEAVGSYTVGWNVIQGSPTQTTIYWDADKNPSAGLIGGYVVTDPTSGDPPPYANNIFVPKVVRYYDPDATPVDAEHTFSVSTNGLTDGNWYYIAIKMQDGQNTRWWYSDLPVRIIQ